MTGACGQKALYGEPGLIAHMLMLSLLLNAFRLGQDLRVSSQLLPSNMLSNDSETLPLSCMLHHAVNECVWAAGHITGAT